MKKGFHWHNSFFQHLVEHHEQKPTLLHYQCEDCGMLLVVLYQRLTWSKVRFTLF